MALLFCVSLLTLGSAQDHVPFLVSAGGDVQTDGNTTVHIALGEAVLAVNDGGQYVGLGFLQGLTKSEPCPVDDLDCLCERNPTDPLCVEFELDDFSFLIDQDNVSIPPVTLDIDGAFHLTVFNRWGKLEFSTLDADGIDSWDGIDQEGEMLKNGVYFYVIEHPGCRKNECKGSITILR